MVKIVIFATASDLNLIVKITINSIAHEIPQTPHRTMSLNYSERRQKKKGDVLLVGRLNGVYRSWMG